MQKEGSEEKRRTMKKEEEKEKEGGEISRMEAVTHGAYGGGMYGTDDSQKDQTKLKNKPPASDTQSADGPIDHSNHHTPSNPPPPSSGDRDIDITGQSYIQ